MWKIAWRRHLPVNKTQVVNQLLLEIRNNLRGWARHRNAEVHPVWWEPLSVGEGAWIRGVARCIAVGFHRHERLMAG